jgi:hypothetical protein
MAITIMGGLLVATVLTLLVVPALYAMWFRVRIDEILDDPVIEAEPLDHAGWSPVPARLAAE